jgi:hypothetical protein
VNFFESQDRVRKNTTKLVLLFALAVVTLIIMTNLLVMVVFGYINSEQLRDGETLIQQMDWQTFVAVGAGVGVVVLVGSLYKIMALSGGGKAVAESLGGQLIPQDTEDLNRRKLLNVVEEMAIASGTPAPQPYIQWRYAAQHSLDGRAEWHSDCRNDWLLYFVFHFVLAAPSR